MPLHRACPLSAAVGNFPLIAAVWHFVKGAEFPHSWEILLL